VASVPSIAFYCPQAAALFRPGSGIPHGGAELDIYYLARAFARVPGWSVHVLVARWPGAGSASVVEPDGVVLHPFYAPGVRANAVAVPWRAASVLRRIRPDVVVQGAAGAETGFLAAWARWSGARFVYRVAHDIDCTREYQAWSPVRGRLFRLGLRRAHLVLALTARQRDLLRRHEGIASEVFPYAHPPIDLPPAPRAARRHVLWIGRFEPWKRPELVLELARRLPHVAFRLVGGLDNPVGRATLAGAAGLGNVELPGRIEFTATPPEFAGAVALVNTSTYEGYPHAFLQALRAGTPLATLDVDPDGTLAAGAHGQCAAGSIDALAAYVDRLWRDASAFDAAAHAAQAHFAAHHDLARLAPALAARLADLVRR